MTALIISNIAIGVISIASITYLLIKLFKAERKLAKYGESTFYKEDKE